MLLAYITSNLLIINALKTLYPVSIPRETALQNTKIKSFIFHPKKLQKTEHIQGNATFSNKL